MKNKLSILIILFIAFNTNSQETGEGYLGAWYMYSGTHKISDRFSINSGAQIREYETTNNLNTILVLTGLSYNFSANITTSMGYGYLNIDSSYKDLPDEINTNEHRLFEQISLKNKLWKFKLEHRYRLEQRFLDFSDRRDTQHRTRYRLQVTLPLSSIFFINIYDEIFLNLQNDVFNQNRLYTALGMKLSKTSKVQLGYMKNNFNSVAFDRLQVGISINTDFRNTKENEYTDTTANSLDPTNKSTVSSTD